MSNEAAHRILGREPPPVSRAEALRWLRGWRAASGAPLAPGDWPLFRALAGETVVGEMLDVALRDGRRASWLISAAPILDAAGGVAGAIAAVEDVTELRGRSDASSSSTKAGAALGETLEFEDVARRLAAIAVPEIADTCRLALGAARRRELPERAVREDLVDRASPATTPR